MLSFFVLRHGLGYLGKSEDLFAVVLRGAGRETPRSHRGAGSAELGQPLPGPGPIPGRVKRTTCSHEQLEAWRRSLLMPQVSDRRGVKSERHRAIAVTGARRSDAPERPPTQTSTRRCSACGCTVTSE